jgi:hypothetical protein
VEREPADCRVDSLSSPGRGISSKGIKASSGMSSRVGVRLYNNSSSEGALDPPERSESCVNKLLSRMGIKPVI